MIIYVAGPYTGATPAEVEANVQRAIDTGIDLMNRGHTPYVPHLSHYFDQRARETGTTISYEFWLDYDLLWLRHCTAILCFGRSPGADGEVAKAREWGMPVYWSVDEVPETNDD